MDTTNLANPETVERSVVEAHMVFIGLVGILDPPREESRGAVEVCQGAGITVHMLTGDHPSTARAIARQVAILSPEMDAKANEPEQTVVMTATQFDQMSEQAIDAMPRLPLVIARCSPTTKVKMIKALHRRNRR
jgi:Na+-exporting ATPase